ncbi:MAG: hypothetical protein SGARI_006489 [Bacillariaceae sp.]
MIEEMKRKQRTTREQSAKTSGEEENKKATSGTALEPNASASAETRSPALEVIEKMHVEAEGVDAITNGSDKCSNGDNFCIQAPAQNDAPVRREESLQGQSQESAIDLADDSDCDDTTANKNVQATNVSSRSSSASINKENDSNASPPGSQQQVPQPHLAAAASKPKTMLNPYLSSKKQVAARTDTQPRSSRETKEHATPAAAKRGSSDPASGGAKRNKSPWQCQRCTFQNDATRA